MTLRRARVSPEDLPESVLRYVIRTRESLLLDDASARSRSPTMSTSAGTVSRSILCLPLIKQAKLVGVLYIENGQSSHVFTPARIAVLRLLASQAAISLENARLYTDLRQTEAYLAEAQRLSRTGSFAFSVSSGEVYWSDEMYRIYEYDRTTKITLDINLQRTHPEEEASIVQKILDRVRLTDAIARSSTGC